MKLKTFITQTLGFVFFVTAVGSAHAQVFKITPGSQGTFPTAQAYNDFLNALETEVNSNLPSVETGQYTKGIANATAMASTGTSAVYGSSFSYGLFGINGGIGLDLGEGNSLSDFDTKKVAGFGAQAAVVLGFNPGAVTTANWWVVDPARLRLYLSFLKMDRTFDGAEVSFSSLGFVGQYRLIPEKSLGLNTVKWNGVDISTGFRMAKMKLEFTQNLEVVFEQDVGGTPETATVNGPITIGGDVNVFSIPVEASTSVRLLYFLNLIGGLGADINLGSSKSIAAYNANIALPQSATATGDLDLGGNAKPSPVNMRAFAGVGFEFAIGTLNLIASKSLNTGTWGLGAGLNFFF
jgi:hypothetical protein